MKAGTLITIKTLVYNKNMESAELGRQSNQSNAFRRRSTSKYCHDARRVDVTMAVKLVLEPT